MALILPPAASPFRNYIFVKKVNYRLKGLWGLGKCLSLLGGQFFLFYCPLQSAGFDVDRETLCTVFAATVYNVILKEIITRYSTLELWGEIWF